MKNFSIRTLTWVFLTLFGTLMLQAQEFDFHWGEDIDLETEIVKIIHRDDNGHYVLTNKRKTYFISYYSNPNFQEKFSTELDIPEVNGRDMELEDVYYMDGNLLLFTSFYDSKAKTQNTYAFKLNEKGQIASKQIDIFNAEVEAKRRSGKTEIRLSRDKTKMLAIHSAPFKNNEKEWNISMKILTPELEVIKEISETIPLEEEDDYIDISNAIISNTGGVYVAARQLSWERKLKLNVTKSMTIYQYDPSNGFEVVEIPVEIGNDKTASSIALEIDKEGNLIGGGFYGERYAKGLMKYEAIKGTYFIKIDRINESLSVKQFSPFGKGFYQEVLTAKALKKGREIPNEYYPRKILLKDNGGVVLIAEYYYHYVSTDQGIRTESITHGPLIVADINAKGEINWVKAIQKDQLFYERRRALLDFGFLSFYSSSAYKVTIYHSFLVGVGQSELYFIFNDNPKNVTLSDRRTLNGYKGAVPVCVTVDSEGNLAKDILREKDRSEVVLRPKITFQDDYGEILIYGSRRKSDKFGTIKF